VNQHLRRWQDLGPSQQQARELISGPNRGTRAKFLSLSREQSRVVTGLLIGHNTLYRHLHLIWLRDSPLCRKCGAEDETSAHILCRCEALASSRHTYLSSFFLEPRDIQHVSLGAIWRFGRAVGLPWENEWGTKGRLHIRPECIGAERPRTPCQSNLTVYVIYFLFTMFLSIEERVFISAQWLSERTVQGNIGKVKNVS
jgi:hypothetical protein